VSLRGGSGVSTAHCLLIDADAVEVLDQTSGVPVAGECPAIVNEGRVSSGVPCAGRVKPSSGWVCGQSAWWSPGLRRAGLSTQRALGTIGGLLLLVVSLANCNAGRRNDVGQGDSESGSQGGAAPSGGNGLRPAPPRDGMVWIPPGALVAGTSPQSVPRSADEEMAGEQLVLTGFYIDRFAFPNEEGAIPLTGVEQAAAARLCHEQDKRLCSELEWERACKGPQQLIYEYGDRYTAERCGTGTKPRVVPAGLRVGCVSGFGVQDLHGGAWEWTDSPWMRRGITGLVTVRGGNSPAGDVTGRCANGRGEPPGVKRADISFRCCAGPRNAVEVALKVRDGRKLERVEAVDPLVVQGLSSHFPAEAVQELRAPAERFRGERLWHWRPVAGDELVALAGCVREPPISRCGLLIGRRSFDRFLVLGWAGSGHGLASLYADVDARDLWMVGEDSKASFQRLVRYVSGRIEVGPRERRIPQRR
jgi:sulfatase modifying factor 1